MLFMFVSSVWSTQKSFHIDELQMIFPLSSYYLSMLMYSFNLCRSLINFQLSKYYLKWKNWTDFFILSIYLSNVLFLNMKFTNHPFQPSSFSFMLCEPFDKKFSTWFKYKTSQVWSELFYIFYYLLISLIQIDKKYKK